jgi:hypothetical protein
MNISLIPVVGWFYLNFDYVTSIFFLLLDHQRFSSSLQYLVHNHINIRHIKLPSSSQHRHFRLYFMDNKFEKIN